MSAPAGGKGGKAGKVGGEGASKARMFASAVRVPYANTLSRI